MNLDDIIENRKLFVLWCGDNEMSDSRKKCLDSIYQNSDCNVKLISTDNLDEYILDEEPFHDAYEYLSYTHRSDYLRAYLMHFHGGAYMDIKMLHNGWGEHFSKLREENTWLVGIPVPDKENVRHKDLRRGWNLDLLMQDKSFIIKYSPYYYKYICSNAFICKPQTPLTFGWYHEMVGRLDILLADLRVNPASIPQDRNRLRSSNPFLRALNLGRSKYPLHWNDILGDIFFPLVYKYKDHIDLTLPEFDFDEPYR